MTTVLIGADGQLGGELRQTFSDDDLVLLTHGDFELANPAQVRDALRTYQSDARSLTFIGSYCMITCIICYCPLVSRRRNAEIVVRH